MDPGMIRHLALGALVPGFASLILFALIWWRRSSPLTHSGLGWLLDSVALAIAVLAGLKLQCVERARICRKGAGCGLLDAAHVR